MSSAESLVEIADGLYAHRLTEFTAARDAAARSVEDRELRARVKALKKPSVAAWAVNLLVRREAEQIDQVLSLGESLRAAAEALDGEELRALTRQRRQLTTALAATARSLARDEGVKLTASVVDQVEDVLNAAMLDPEAASLVRSGLVLTGFSSSGLGGLDLPSLVAVPEAIGRRATALEARQPEPPTLSVVPDDHLRLEEARERLEEAGQRVTEATQEVEEVSSSVERLRARRLQLRQEIDELQRRMGVLESDVDDVDDDLDEASSALEDAQVVLEEAQRERDQARAEVDRLG